MFLSVHPSYAADFVQTSAKAKHKEGQGNSLSHRCLLMCLPFCNCRRAYMFERLNKLGFKIYGGNGGYMCWVDITAGSGQTARPRCFSDLCLASAF